MSHHHFNLQKFCYNTNTFEPTMTAKDIIDRYIQFYKDRGHVQIANASLVPENDPTTLFTSSGMQPLVPYLLGEEHPGGKRLVDVQNCFRAQDIDEIGDNRHTTFFRMLGNWSLGDYTKKEQLPWFFEFLTKELELPANKLYVTVFEGYADIPEDIDAMKIWEKLFKDAGVDPTDRIFYYGVDKNWWSRSGTPEQMPEGEPGGPSSEVFFDFGTPHDKRFGETCHPNCDCGRFVEIGNNVFMQYIKTANGFELLPQQNIDFGGGLERILAPLENKPDVFKTSLFYPIIQSIEKTTGAKYEEKATHMRIITDHFIAATMIGAQNVRPSNKEQGYILRRLIRRGLDNFYALNGKNIEPVLEKITEQYLPTDPVLSEKYEEVKDMILEEEQSYTKARKNAIVYVKSLGLNAKLENPNIIREKKEGDELMGIKEIPAEEAFKVYTSFGLSPTQIRSLGYTFDEQAFAEKMEEHQSLSRKGATQKFKGGLADTEEKTIHGHTATHLLHKALRDKFGESVHQTGSNITTERVRFDFSFDRKLTPEELKDIEDTVNKKIKENLPVYYKIIPIEEARKLGAIGLFGEKYDETVKVYFIGGSQEHPEEAYSKEFCGGPHVEFTGDIHSFTIVKEEGLGKGMRRMYAKVG